MSSGNETVHRQLERNGGNPGLQIVEHVAELEGKDETDLPSMYDCVDGVLDDLFSDPPAPEARMEVSFNYQAYRITIDQDGSSTLVKTGEGQTG